VFGVRDVVSHISIWKTERGDVTFMTAWTQRYQGGWREIRYVHMVQDKDIDKSGGRRRSKGKWTKAPLQ
jgi:hypothetical protein